MADTPVALLHGFAGAPASWDPVIAAWPGERPSFVRPALPGHDAAPASPQASFSSAVATVAGHLPSDELHVVGYSLGGRIALGMAVEGRTRIQRLTLIGVNPGLDDDVRAPRRASDEQWAQLLDDRGLAAFLERWTALPLFASQRDLPDHVRGAQSDLRSQLDAAQLSAAMRQMSLANMPDYRPSLSKLTCPTLLIAGQRDEKFCRLAESMAEQLPHARVSIVASVGHNVPLEAPEALAERLAEFHRDD